MTDDDQAAPDVADPPPGTPPPPATSLTAALEDALATTPHLPRDRAMIELARRYAAMLDDATDRMDDAAETMNSSDGEDGARDFGRMITTVTRLGPRLETVLDKLGMSPSARRGDGAPNVPNDPAAAALAALEREYAARVNLASLVDPAVEASLP